MSASSFKESHRHGRITFKNQKPGLFALTFLLSPEERKAVYSLFAFHHFAMAGFKDRGATAGAQSCHLKSCEALLERVYNHDVKMQQLPFEPALTQTVTRFRIAQDSLMSLLEGSLLTLHFRRPLDENELLQLSFSKGGVWGVFLSAILNPQAPPSPLAALVFEALWLNEKWGDSSFAPLSWTEMACGEDVNVKFRKFCREKLVEAKRALLLEPPSRFRSAALIFLRAALIKNEKEKPSSRLSWREKLSLVPHFVRWPS